MKGVQFPVEAVIIALAGFLATMIKSAVGLGAGVLIAPVLALFIEPRLAVGMTAPVMLLSSLVSLRTLWGRWDWPLLRRLLPTALVGLMCGSLFLAWAPAEQVRRSIGVVALLFAISQVRRLLADPGRRQRSVTPLPSPRQASPTPSPGHATPPPSPRQASPAPSPGHATPPPSPSQAPPAPVASVGSLLLPMLLGFFGGIVSGIAHAGGLLFSIYLLPRLSKVAFVASLTLTLFVVDTFRLLTFSYLGVLELRHLLLALLSTPLMFLGAAVGRWLNQRLSETGFVWLLVLLVAMTGLGLLLR